MRRDFFRCCGAAEENKINQGTGGRGEIVIKIFNWEQ